ncbi:S1 RNA-binding domain-containing protein [Helicobacter cappadocius]|uniref:S1-like domain-containing RNA-binding protein n=1 Tax=Helicobacter cappadocius TaxID=3063998 RepID=A0AA90Q2N9_9HELI|nr:MULTISPECIES: S1-like domain-containing RNA-binding protein [unclassified Helicobacter]MDO7253003.1 S1-like domain-containing RNA-binding protein [Helicobacter sp. faydin-H75]MDP2539008.1 S1-like domain-containing RNA-binding protein [Helicobacter sp. faydin-H76]
MQPGKIQKLQISRFSDNGAYLKDSFEEEVLLPNKFVSQDLKIGDFIEVFLYTDSLDRPVATTQKPYGVVDEILTLKIISIEEKGCFLDIGIDKDIFMPTKAPKRFKIGEFVAVRITLDKQGRLIARLGIKEHLKPYKFNIPYVKVEILPFEKTPLGIGCVVNEEYYGLLYKNQIFSPVQIGEKNIAYISKIRSDGKVDLSLKPIGDKSEDKIRLLKIIAEHKILELDFDSPPEEIQKTCQMSKKSFKTLISILLKESKIKILDSSKHAGKKAVHIA